MTGRRALRATDDAAGARLTGQPTGVDGSGDSSLLELEGVRAGYGGIEVLHGIDLAVPEGEVVALLGANGAGKSTAVKVAAGLLRPTAGSVRVAGHDVTGVARHERGRLEHLLEVVEHEQRMFSAKLLDEAKHAEPWGIAFAKDPQQKFMFVIDGTNEKIHVYDRQSEKELYTFGGGGRIAGQFYAVHNIATDSKGNLYTTETYRGQRVQKFVYKGMIKLSELVKKGTVGGSRINP